MTAPPLPPHNPAVTPNWQDSVNSNSSTLHAMRKNKHWVSQRHFSPESLSLALSLSLSVSSSLSLCLSPSLSVCLSLDQTSLVGCS